MQWTGARKVRAQKFHLVGQHAAALQIDVFGMRGREGIGEQLHAGLFRCTSGFVVVAAFAGGNHVVPDIVPTVTQWRDVIA